MSNITPKIIEANIQAGNLKEAMDQVDDAIKEHPESARAHLLKSYILEKQGHKAESQKEFSQIITLDKTGDTVNSLMYKNLTQEYIVINSVQPQDTGAGFGTYLGFGLVFAFIAFVLYRLFTLPDTWSKTNSAVPNKPAEPTKPVGVVKKDVASTAATEPATADATQRPAGRFYPSLNQRVVQPRGTSLSRPVLPQTVVMQDPVQHTTVVHEHHNSGPGIPDIAAGVVVGEAISKALDNSFYNRKTAEDSRREEPRHVPAYAAPEASIPAPSSYVAPVVPTSSYKADDSWTDSRDDSSSSSKSNSWGDSGSSSSSSSSSSDSWGNSSGSDSWSDSSSSSSSSSDSGSSDWS